MEHSEIVEDLSYFIVRVFYNGIEYNKIWIEIRTNKIEWDEMDVTTFKWAEIDINKGKNC